MSRSEVWFIRPRDPLVLGDGRGPIAFFARRAWPLPLPQTLAGMVRAQFVRETCDVDRGHALELLREVRIEGPWLVKHTEDRTRQVQITPWAFAPADASREVRKDPAGSGADAHLLHRDRMRDVHTDEGVLWPQGARPLPSLLVPQTRVVGHKTVPAFPFWPLSDVIGWGLEMGVPIHDPGYNRPVLDEPRVHVALGDDTGTADPGMLFSSAGGRFAKDFGLLLKVTGPTSFTAKGPHWPGESDMVVLGGEARPSFRSVLDGGAYPTFSSHQAQYEAAAKQGRSPCGLRLQLLTHACLYPPSAAPGAEACFPSWLGRDGEGEHPSMKGLRLRLRALRLAQMVPVSGWDLQGGAKRAREGAPRRVRRLVPAGTVYCFDVLTGPDWHKDFFPICEKLFAAPLDPVSDAIDQEQHQSHASHDGMGLCLPGLFLPPPKSEVAP